MAYAVNSKTVETNLRRAMQGVARSVKSRLLTPTVTWNHPPDFTIQDMMDGGDMVERVETDSDEYFWLDEGTTVRHAVMTKDFLAKTTPRSFAAKAGSGGLQYVNKNTFMPGIQAREWTKMAELEYGPVLQAAVDKELSGIANNLFVLTKRRHGVIDE